MVYFILVPWTVAECSLLLHGSETPWYRLAVKVEEKVCVTFDTIQLIIVCVTCIIEFIN